MADIAKIKVKEMPRASLLQDGTYVEMEFKGDIGESVILGFDPPRLDDFVSRVQQLNHQARTQREAKSGHADVLPLPVVKAMAQESVGGAVVILSFRTENGQVYSFAIPPDEANELRNQMTAAIGAARKQARQTRQ